MSVQVSTIGMKAIIDKTDKYQRLVDGRGLRWITTETAFQAKKKLLEVGRTDTGGDLALSGWRRPPRKPVKLRAGFELRSDSRAEFIPKPNGVWKVLEEGRLAGISKTRRRRVGRRYGQTSGRSTWTRAWAMIDPQVPGWVAKANSELLKNCWK